ncbi:cytochrome P450 [Thamnidium elegans]|nr:cytochrome P450 [Thamnidium elegans]BDB32869.1 cytochrome P450 monooxygenase [Thamnidium elegans]
MDYLNKLQSNTPIQNAIQLIKQLPVSHRLTDMYKRSTKNELMLVGAATFITLYNLSAYIKAQRQKLHLPPTVPFSLPLFGHTLYLMAMPNKFLDWCNQKYGEIYNLDVNGKTVTVTNGKSAEEAMKADQDDLSLEHGIVRDLLHLDYVFDADIMDIGIRVNPVVAKFAIPNAKMPQYVPGIQRGLENAVDELLKQDINHIQEPSLFFQNFVAYMSVPSLVGDEFGLNKEVIQSFAGFTGDVIKNVALFMIVPKFLHKLVLPYVQSAKKHQDVMAKYIAPVIIQRREKMRLAEEAGEAHGMEENFLQGLVEYTDTDENGNPIHFNEIELAHAVLMVAFASVHTTSMNLSFSLYWLLARPDLMARLLQEIEEVCPGSAPITHAELGQMKFLNNFMREVLRQGSDRLANGKKAMHDYTFANGYQVPKGRIVESSLRQLNFGNNVIRSEVDDMDPDMSLNRISTTPARDFVSFGMGKHLCPGRFFAVQEIQMSLVYLLKNFEIKTASGKRPEPVTRIAGTIATNCEEPLVFIAKK